MRHQSLRALACVLAAPASPAVTSVSRRCSRQEGWGCNNLNRLVGAMLIREPSGAPRTTGGTRRITWSLVPMSALAAAFFVQSASAQRAFTWQEIRDKFEAQNPTLRAGEIGISESRTQEITAYLRHNPDLTATVDQIDPFTSNP
jgi:hypothetical protein